VINPPQRPLPDNTQQPQQTNIHAPGGIRTYNRSRRTAEDLCLRPRGNWDRLFTLNTCCKQNVSLTFTIKRQSDQNVYSLNVTVQRFKFTNRMGLFISCDSPNKQRLFSPAYIIIVFVCQKEFHCFIRRSNWTFIQYLNPFRNTKLEPKIILIPTRQITLPFSQLSIRIAL
jgi:hypothetical protein